MSDQLTAEEQAEVALFGSVGARSQNDGIDNNDQFWRPCKFEPIFGDRCVSFNEVVEWIRANAGFVSCSHWGLH